jgi:hypothetical protein
MREHSGESDKTRLLINCGCLDGRDLLVTERLTHDVEAAGKRCVPELTIAIMRV